MKYNFSLKPQQINLANSGSNVMDGFNFDFSKIGLPSADQIYSNSDLSSLLNFNAGVTNNVENPMSALDKWLGKDGKAGYANTAMNVVGGLGNMWLGYQGLQNSRDALKFQKEQWDFNKKGQVALHNSALADRQNARIAANPNAGFASVADYMKQYGV